MKRLILVVILAFLPAAILLAASAAHASPELAEAWGAKAVDLSEETSDMIAALETGEDIVPDPDYTEGMARFSATASRLGVWSETSGAGADFGCIYRGMAEEAEVQLTVLESGGDIRDVYASLIRLAALFDDAQAIAVASAHAARRGRSSATDANASCAASAAMTHQYLTEQP